MTDKIDPIRRSANMARIRSRNTKPERLVRSILHRLGYRFRLHAKDLPGSPDIVFRSRRKAIFVHGCFWHSHPGCRRAFKPSSRQEFWQAKLARTVARDKAAIHALEQMGWESHVIWECELGDTELAPRLAGFVGCRRIKV